MAFDKIVQEPLCLDEKAKVTTMLKVCERPEATKMLQTMENIDKFAGSIKAACEKMAVEHSVRDCDSFISGLMKAVDDVETPFAQDFIDGGRFVGHMCIVQAVKRPLTTGETREQLIRKCSKLFKKKPYLVAWPHMQQLLKPTSDA